MTLTMEDRLAAIRSVQRITPVLEGHVPRWLVRLVRGRYRLELRGVPALFHLQAAAQVHGSGLWLDHWGSTSLGGKLVFVSEPFAHMAYIDEARRIADSLGIELSTSDKSWWHPGRTTRLIFWPAGYSPSYLSEAA